MQIPLLFFVFNALARRLFVSLRVAGRKVASAIETDLDATMARNEETRLGIAVAPTTRRALWRRAAGWEPWRPGSAAGGIDALRRPQARAKASSAPCFRLRSLAQAISGSTTPKPANVEKPQSVPAITRSLPTAPM